MHQLHLKLSVKMVNISGKKKDNTAYSYKWLPENKEKFPGSIIGHLPVFSDIVNSMNVLDLESINNCVTKFTEAFNKLADPLIE